MSVSVPTSANDFIRRQLDDRLEAIEQHLNADALCLIASLYPGIDDGVRDDVEHLRGRRRQSDRLVVLLTTYGGQIETVQRIVETLRRHYQHVDFVIPNYAFSAGTVLAMSGDQIYMDYYSRLGPIDPQVPSNSGRYVPALGYLIQWDRLKKKADAGKISQAELQLMILAFDQAALYQYEQARQLSIELLKEWLATYKFKNWISTRTRGIAVTPRMRTLRAAKIARDLSNTDRWHSHGSGISMDVLRNEINLEIDDLDQNPPLNTLVKQYDRLLADYMQTVDIGSMLHVYGRFRPVS